MRPRQSGDVPRCSADAPRHYGDVARSYGNVPRHYGDVPRGSGNHSHVVSLLDAELARKRQQSVKNLAPAEFFLNREEPNFTHRPLLAPPAAIPNFPFIKHKT